MILGFLDSHPRADLEELGRILEDGSPGAVIVLPDAEENNAGKRYATAFGLEYRVAEPEDHPKSPYLTALEVLLRDCNIVVAFGSPENVRKAMAWPRLVVLPAVRRKSDG